MAWIQSDQALQRHPKTKRLARVLGVSIFEAMGILHALWYWSLDYAEDGDLGRYKPEDIADGIEWPQDADGLWGALLESGFVDQDGHIHDWEEYTGKLIEKRREDVQRKRRYRGADVPPMSITPAYIDEGLPTDVPRMSRGQAADVPRMSAVEREKERQPTKTTNPDPPTTTSAREPVLDPVTAAIAATAAPRPGDPEPVRQSRASLSRRLEHGDVITPSDKMLVSIRAYDAKRAPPGTAPPLKAAQARSSREGT